MITPEDIPQELIAMLNERAGLAHNRNGQAVSALVAILNEWEELKRDREQPPPSPALVMMSKRWAEQKRDHGQTSSPALAPSAHRHGKPESEFNNAL